MQIPMIRSQQRWESDQHAKRICCLLYTSNGKRVEDGVEEILTHDSLVRLADEEFTFKIR